VGIRPRVEKGLPRDPVLLYGGGALVLRAVSCCSRSRGGAGLERRMVEVLLMVGLVGFGICCVLFLRHQAPGRRIARDRRRESTAYRKRMAERHGPDAFERDRTRG
jgi:hypothetical protein